MSCNTKTSLAAVIDAVNAQLNNNYVDRDDPRIDQGVFTEPTIRGGLMLDEAAKLDFCGYVTECGHREPFGKQWLDRPLYPHNTLVSYEDGGEIKSRWQDIDDVVAGTEIGESYTAYEETRSLGLQGYTIIDSFELGATITQRNQALRHAATGKLYRWAGDLPKITPAGSTPVSSGGVDTNAWLEVSDTALRQDILTGGLITDTLVTATALPGGVALRQDQKNKRIVYIEDFDEVGSLDKGIALRKAVAYLDSIGGGTLLFEPGKVYECSLIVLPTGVRGAAYIPSKVHLNLQGAEIKTNSAVNYFSYNILDFELSNTNSVNNGTLRGNSTYTPLSTDGEWGFGIGLSSTKNFSSRNLTILECGGDGVYVGCHIIDKGTPEARTNVPSQNINFDNLVIKDCLRQGISIISADNVNINNLTIENIAGKSPEAAVDFEPNYPEQQLTRIIINNFKSSGCKRGILFNFVKFNKTTKPVSITINNYSDANSRDNAIHFKNGNMTNDYGFIHFTGKTHLKNSVNPQLHIACSEGTEIMFDDLTIESDSTITNTNPVDLGQNTRTADAGGVNVGLQNITIKSLKVYGVNFRKFGTIHTNNNGTGVVKNINIHVDDARIADPLISAQFELNLANVTSPDVTGNFINLTGREKVYNVRDTVFTLNKDAVGRVVQQTEINLNIVTEGIPFTLIAGSLTTDFVTVIPSGSHKFSLPGAAIAQRMKLANGGHIRAMRKGDTYRILSGVGFELLPAAV